MEYLILTAVAVGLLTVLGLLPMRAVRLQFGSLLAADATTLAPGVDANKIVLVVSNTGESEGLAIGDLTPASFTGSTPIAGATGAQEVGIDPVTGEQVITIKPPAGGFRWITGDAVGLPQTVYGYALTDNAGATLLGYKRLPTPIGLTAAGQIVDIGTVNINMVLQPAS